MTPREMQNDFEYKVDRYDSNLIVPSHLIFHWINKAQEFQVINHYTEHNPYKQGFEQNQKRMDDLRTMIIETTIPVDSISTSAKPNSYTVTLPTDYLFLVGEEANITFTPNGGGSDSKLVEVYPVTSDRYVKEVNSPFGKHILHYETATPLRLEKDNSVELITDGNYSIDSYLLRYIKYPNDIYLGGPDCELPEHMHRHIVEKAVNFYLESIGDKEHINGTESIADME